MGWWDQVGAMMMIALLVVGWWDGDGSAGQLVLVSSTKKNLLPPEKLPPTSEN